MEQYAQWSILLPHQGGAYVAHRHADFILGKTKALKAYFPFMEEILHARPIPLSLVICGRASCSYTA